MRVLVTGARGFIGSTFIRGYARQVMKGIPHNITRITAFARDTNSWTRGRLENDENVQKCIKEGIIKISYGDLNGDISGLCEGIDATLHFAAKTYVDHSIKDPKPFVETNVIGTLNLLEEARKQNVKQFIHVSTDEVYGQILQGAYSEDAPLNPRNPYAASKAGADALTQSYFHTFGMWTAVTRTENNYGIMQHPQKAIPVFIAKALSHDDIPVYGDGKHVRQWLHVDDHVNALMMLLEADKNSKNSLPGGEIWHIAGNQELSNTELATKICDILHRDKNLIKYIDDMNIRPGHDRRYALKCDKMDELVGWQPRIMLNDGLEDMIKWYVSNSEWLR